MRFVFKTSYEQDLGLFRDAVQRNWYVALLAGAARAAPRWCPTYLVDISLVFIYGLCGLSLMVLAGYTGLVSLGHAAFLGIGAYAHVYFIAGPRAALGASAVALAAVLTAARRRARRPARAAHDRRLPHDRHAGLRADHPGGVHPLGARHRRPQGQGRWTSRSIFGVSFAARRGVLLPVPGLPRRRALAHRQPAALADRPGLGGDPRQRDRRPVDGREPRRLQDAWPSPTPPALMGVGGRALRAQDRLPRPRHLHACCCRSSSC